MDKGLEKTLIRESPPLSFPLVDMSVQVCYVIPKSWWVLWCSYVGLYFEAQGDRPKDLDNSELVLSKKNEENLVFLRKISWKRLKGWYNAGPTFKVFIVKGKPQWKSHSLDVMLPNGSRQKVSVPLKMTLSDFRDFIVKKFSLVGKLEISTSNSYCTSKHYAYDSTLKDLGFNSVAFVRFSKVHHQEYDVDEFELFDISDHYDEDLKKAIEISAGEQHEVKNLKNRQVREFETRELEDFGIKEKFESVKVLVCKALAQEKIQLKVKSLKKVRKNVERILNDLDANI